MNKIFLICILILTYSVTANAQSDIQKDDSTKHQHLQLNEIVVAASKDNSRLKDLPLSASVIQNITIESNEIKSLTDVSVITPNFVMPEYGSKLTSPVYIRGVGSRINSPSVGLYVDDVPYFDKDAFAFDFLDVERVEILRGPQGTLYGRNSMAGLINVVTKSPMYYQGKSVKLSAGSYGNYNISGGFYNKFRDNFAVSVASNFKHTDGFHFNHFLSEKVDKLNSLSINSKIIYHIKERLQLENIFSTEISNQGGYPYALYNDSLKSPENISYNQKSTYERNLINNSFKLKYIGKNWVLTNSLSFQFLEGTQKIDQDFTPDSLYFVQQLQSQKMNANEVIVRSRENRKYDWLVGAFAFIQKHNTEVKADVYKSGMWYIKEYHPETKGIAFFHQSTYKLSDNFSIVAGIRYDYETSAMHYIYTGERNRVNLPKTDTLYPLLTDKVILPKIAFNYKFKNSSIYTSYTTGYKPGGFNSTFESPDQLKFKNEKSYNYEAGVKSAFFDNLIYADFALFYTKLKNQQIYRTVPSGRGAYLDNAGLSENKGFELNIKTRSANGFEGVIAYGYTNSKILEYVKDDTTNYNNNVTPYIPRYTLTLQLNKFIYLNAGNYMDEIRISLLYNQNGSQYWNLENSYKEDSYGLLNAKVSFVKKSFQIELWGKNLMNKYYNAFLFESLDNTYIQAGRPFHAGINMLIEF